MERSRVDNATVLAIFNPLGLVDLEGQRPGRGKLLAYLRNLL